MISRGIHEELENEICFDSSGALDLSPFKLEGSKKTDLTEQCDVCGDKATGTQTLYLHVRYLHV